LGGIKPGMKNQRVALCLCPFQQQPEQPCLHRAQGQILHQSSQMSRLNSFQRHEGVTLGDVDTAVGIVLVGQADALGLEARRKCFGSVAKLMPLRIEPLVICQNHRGFDLAFRD
jgi:hypothetical protein